MSFWAELRRRNVVKVGVAYAIVAWLLIQVAGEVLPTFDAPRWVLQTVTFLLILGFPVALILAWAYEITPEGIKPSAQVDSADSITHVTGQRLKYAAIGLLVIAVAFMFVDNYVLTNGRETAARATPDEAPDSARAGSETAVQPREVLPNSVAVLPLVNLSPNPDNAYFAAGMHEEILNQLAKLRNLSVISRTTMLRYRDTTLTVPEIARELNVGSVVEGSVRFDGQNVLVTAQLIDAATDSHLWSDSYERELAGVFAIQADIAMNVANSLNAEFSLEEQARIERPPTSSPAAYALLLQVSDLVATNRRELAHQILDRAIELDPGFALAYARQASLYATTLINTTAGSARAWEELEPLVRDYADRALELDPESALALAALGHLSNFTWRWTEARQDYDRAMLLRRGDLFDGIGAVGGWFMAWSSDPDAAADYFAPLVDVNPLFWGAHWFYGTLLQYAGDYDRAADSFRRGIELAPALSLQHSWLAYAEIGRGNLDAARAALESAEGALGANRAVINLVDIAYCFGRIGNAAEAERLFEEISTLAQQQDIGAGGWAFANLAVGNVDEALDWLEQAAAKAARHEVDAGYYTLMNIKLNVAADPVLERPEFVEVRRRLRGD